MTPPQDLFCKMMPVRPRHPCKVHCAIGYTFEQDVHVWMKRAWTLADAWGTDAFHRRRAADAVIDGAHPYGPRGPA